MESENKMKIIDMRKISKAEQYEAIHAARQPNFSGILIYHSEHDNIAETREYYKKGKYHRVDGPAYLSTSGNPVFYLHGKNYSKEEWFEKLTEDQKMRALFNADEWNQGEIK